MITLAPDTAADRCDTKTKQKPPFKTCDTNNSMKNNVKTPVQNDRYK
jgi:hypothetical protein